MEPIRGDGPAWRDIHTVMAYSAYRFLAAFCFFTIILSPFGVFFWWVANRKEKEREKEVEALEQLAEGKNGVD